MQKWMTVAEVAEYARRHPRTVGDAMRATDLHAFQSERKKGSRRGGNWLADVQCVDAWIEGRPCPHAQAQAA